VLGQTGPRKQCDDEQQHSTHKYIANEETYQDKGFLGSAASVLDAQSKRRVAENGADLYSRDVNSVVQLLSRAT